jgi:HPt (histidine-containing phosphotransfer) domain-containing protein
LSDPGAGDPLHDSMHDSMQEMKSYFAGRLPARIAEVEAARDAVRSAGWTGEPLRTFHRLAHSLAGAGATFGFPEVSDLAGRLERRLKALLAGGPPPTDAALADVACIAEVDGLLAELRGTIPRDAPRD